MFRAAVRERVARHVLDKSERHRAGGILYSAAAAGGADPRLCGARRLAACKGLTSLERGGDGWKPPRRTMTRRATPRRAPVEQVHQVTKGVAA